MRIFLDMASELLSRLDGTKAGEEKNVVEEAGAKVWAQTESGSSKSGSWNEGDVLSLVGEKRVVISRPNNPTLQFMHI